MPTSTPAQALSIATSLSLAGLPTEYPADSSLRSEFSTSPISISSRGLLRDRGAILPQPFRWRGVLKPSSVPLGVIQDMYLNDTHKGREGSPKSKCDFVNSLWFRSRLRADGGHPPWSFATTCSTGGSTCDVVQVGYVRRAWAERNQQGTCRIVLLLRRTDTVSTLCSNRVNLLKIREKYVRRKAFFAGVLQGLETSSKLSYCLHTAQAAGSIGHRPLS